MNSLFPGWKWWEVVAPGCVCVNEWVWACRRGFSKGISWCEDQLSLWVLTGMFYFSPAAVCSQKCIRCSPGEVFVSPVFLWLFFFLFHSSYCGRGLFCDVKQSIVRGWERRWWDKHLPGMVWIQLVLSRAGQVAGGGDQGRRNLREEDKCFVDIFFGLSSLIFKFIEFS